MEPAKPIWCINKRCRLKLPAVQNFCFFCGMDQRPEGEQTPVDCSAHNFTAQGKYCGRCGAAVNVPNIPGTEIPSPMWAWILCGAHFIVLVLAATAFGQRIVAGIIYVAGIFITRVFIQKDTEELTRLGYHIESPITLSDAPSMAWPAVAPIYLIFRGLRAPKSWLPAIVSIVLLAIPIIVLSNTFPRPIPAPASDPAPAVNEIPQESLGPTGSGTWPSSRE
jgi:hypothetical protein